MSFWIRPDRVDEVVQDGLDTKIKYVRIIRGTIRGKQRYFAQLINAGEPYRKQKNTIGNSQVGIDIGPSTATIVSSEKENLL